MVFEVGLQLDTPEQCATWYPTQHIPAPSDQHSTVLPCGQSLEEMQHTDVSMQKWAKLTIWLLQQDAFKESLALNLMLCVKPWNNLWILLLFVQTV